MERAYSVLRVKSLDDEARIIRGIATSPDMDRVGDVVDPLGAQFKNPMPLLWQHRHDKPVGTVIFDKPTEKGITFEAHLPKIEEAGALRDRVDEAWQSIKSGLVSAVSIGFRAIESEMTKTGFLFKKSEIIELSLVTIPSNASAVITAIKSMDSQHRAASGEGAAIPQTPGDSGEKAHPGAVWYRKRTSVDIVRKQLRRNFSN